MAGFEGFSEDLRSAPSSFRSDDPATSVLYGRAFSADLAVALTPEEARLVHDAEIQSLEGTLEMALADFQQPRRPVSSCVASRKSPTSNEQSAPPERGPAKARRRGDNPGV